MTKVLLKALAYSGQNKANCAFIIRASSSGTGVKVRNVSG